MTISCRRKVISSKEMTISWEEIGRFKSGPLAGLWAVAVQPATLGAHWQLPGTSRRFPAMPARVRECLLKPGNVFQVPGMSYQKQE
jgi:hypothetical protein